MWMLYTHGFNMMLMLMSMKASWSNDRFGLTCQTNLIWFPVFVAKHASLCGWPLKTRRPLWESYLQWLFCRFADSERNRHWTTSCRSLSRRYIHIDKHTSHTSKLSVWTPTHSLQRTFMTHALRRPVTLRNWFTWPYLIVCFVCFSDLCELLLQHCTFPPGDQWNRGEHGRK